MAGQIAELTRASYGTVEGARKWYQTYRHFLLNDLKARASIFDPSAYILEKDGGIIAAMSIVVGDLTMAVRPDQEKYVEGKLKAKYTYGTWDVGEGKCLGRFLKQREDWSIEVTQSKWVSEMTPLTIGKGRKDDDLCTPEEITAMRSLNGKAAWYAKETRPDWLYATSVIAGTMPRPRISDLKMLNGIVKSWLKEPDMPLVFRHIPPGEMEWLTYADASWSGEKGMRSQAGWITVAVRRDVCEKGGSVANIIGYRSHRLHRVTPSTLDAESMGFIVRRLVRMSSNNWCGVR